MIAPPELLQVLKVVAGKLLDLLIAGVSAGQNDIHVLKRGCRTKLCLLLALPLFLAVSVECLAAEERPEKDANSGIELQKPSLPDGKPDDHPIDRLLAVYFSRHSVVTDNTIDDAVFARRVYLDIIELLPTQRQLAEFLAEIRPDKRALLVDQLLALRDARQGRESGVGTVSRLTARRGPPVNLHPTRGYSECMPDERTFFNRRTEILFSWLIRV